MDGTIVFGNDLNGIEEVKSQLKEHLQTKILGQIRYFLGIEVAHSKREVLLSQRKNVQDLLIEKGMLGSKPTNTPMDPNL